MHSPFDLARGCCYVLECNCIVEVNTYQWVPATFRPLEKGGKKKKKKTLVLTLGSPPDLDFRTWVSRLKQTQQRILLSSHLFPVIFLCVHRHFSFSCHVVCASSGQRQTASSGHRPRTDAQTSELIQQIEMQPWL